MIEVICLLNIVAVAIGESLILMLFNFAATACAIACMVHIETFASTTTCMTRFSSELSQAMQIDAVSESNINEATAASPFMYIMS